MVQAVGWGKEGWGQFFVAKGGAAEDGAGGSGEVGLEHKGAVEGVVQGSEDLGGVRGDQGGVPRGAGAAGEHWDLEWGGLVGGRGEGWGKGRVRWCRVWWGFDVLQGIVSMGTSDEKSPVYHSPGSRSSRFFCQCPRSRIRLRLFHASTQAIQLQRTFGSLGDI